LADAARRERRIVPLAEAKKLYERVGSNRKHIKIFTAEDGGAEHCQVDHRQLGVERLAACEHVSVPCDEDVPVPRFEPVDADARA
jgi:hypothetical protein